MVITGMTDTKAQPVYITEQTATTTYPDRPCMLTTIDNPYNPFTDWDRWLKYDRDNGYYTNEYLARVAYTDETLSNEENESLLRQAMREIADYNPTNLWIVIYKPV